MSWVSIYRIIPLLSLVLCFKKGGGGGARGEKGGFFFFFFLRGGGGGGRQWRIRAYLFFLVFEQGSFINLVSFLIKAVLRV